MEYLFSSLISRDQVSCLHCEDGFRQQVVATHSLTLTMDFPHLQLLLALFQNADIPMCIICEFALNSDNAPRIAYVGPSVF